jgi:hypothetical protein
MCQTSSANDCSTANCIAIRGQLEFREAHVYSTTDGFCLDVFVVDGWEMEVNFKNADT